MSIVSPYGGVKKEHVTRHGEPVREAMRAGDVTKTGAIRESNTENLFDKAGEFNAGSRKELLASINYLIKQHMNGGAQVRYAHQSRQVAEERLAILREAAYDRSGQALQVLGEVIAEEIWQTMNREGFTRKIFILRPLGKGEVGRIRIRKKDVLSFVISTDGNTTEQRIRQPYIYPPEFYLTAFILIEDKELEQASTDLLDEKYQDGLENIMVAEDKLTKLLLDRAAPVVNNIIFFNSFTPQVFTSLRTQIISWNIPCPTALIAYDLWDDIIADPDFTAWYEPVTKHELILEGKLGSLLDVELITDAFRHETFKVLDPGEVYFLGAPIALGGVTQRKELAAEAINTYNQGRPARGWFLEQIQGQFLGNARSVSKGVRV